MTPPRSRKKSTEPKEENNMANIDDLLGTNSQGVQDDSNSAPPFGDAFDDDSVFGDGMFEDVDFEAIPDDPFQLPPNTYIMRVTSAKMNPGKENVNRYSIAMVYEVIDGQYKGRKVREWLHYPTKNDGVEADKKVISLSLMKARLTAFGYAPDEIKSFNHRNYQEMMIGKEFAGTTYNQKDRNSDQVNVRLNKTTPLNVENSLLSDKSLDFGEF